MPNTAAALKEQDLARELNLKLQRSLTTKRSRYAALMIILFAAAIAACIAGLWMLGLILTTAALICLLQYFDANGSLHEVRRRSTRLLVPDFSVLRRTDGTAATQNPSSA